MLLGTKLIIIFTDVAYLGSLLRCSPAQSIVDMWFVREDEMEDICAITVNRSSGKGHHL